LVNELLLTEENTIYELSRLIIKEVVVEDIWQRTFGYILRIIAKQSICDTLANAYPYALVDIYA